MCDCGTTTFPFEGEKGSVSRSLDAELDFLPLTGFQVLVTELDVVSEDALVPECPVLCRPHLRSKV